MKQIKFLQEAAEYVTDKYEHLSDNCIILPGSRSILVFKNYIRNLQKKHILPDIMTIADFMEKISGCKLAEDEEIIVDLFEIYRNLHPKADNSLQQFSGNAQIMLQDFNDIDMSLAENDKIFSQLLEIKKDEAEFAEENKKHVYRRYIEFCKELPIYYKSLREKLLSKGKAYRGLMYREAFNKLEEQLKRLPYEMYIFIGFNALSISEESIVKKLKNRNMSDMICDSDDWYMNDKSNNAGKFLRKLKKNLNAHFFSHDFLNNGEDKYINMIGFPQESAQATYLPQILNSIRKRDENAKCLIVPLKENMLLPVLYAIKDNEMNISMEYGIHNTPVYDLIHSYLSILENREKFKFASNSSVERLYHRDLRNFFDNIFLSEKLKRDNCPIDFSKENKLFYTCEDLNGILEKSKMGSKCRKLFSEMFFSENNAKNVKNNLKAFLEFMDEEGKDNCGSDKFSRQTSGITKIMIEKAEKIYDILNKIEYADISSIRFMIENLLRRFSIPFESDKESNIQITGMLETRSLDFDYVIMLSVNEGVIPNKKSSETMIPFDLRTAFGLPDFRNHEAIMTYHFFRLLQRAKESYLLYNMDNRHEIKEKSRLLKQIELQWKNIKGVHINSSIIPLPQAKKNAVEIISIAKNGEIIETLNNLTFSPSNLNQYLECSLKFYLQNVVKLKVPEKPYELIQANTMGIVVHKILEKHLRPDKLDFNTKNIKDEIIECFCDEELTGLNLKKDEIIHEKNRLVLELCNKYVCSYLDLFKKDLTSGANPIQSVEYKINKKLNSDKFSINFFGIIDRIDLYENSLCVTDYKTGRVNQKQLKLSSMEEAFDGEHKEALQLISYMYMLYACNGTKSLRGKIISFQNLKEDLLLTVDRESVLNEEHFKKFENLLSDMIREIFDTKTNFQACKNEKKCTYCNFKNLCHQ